MIALSGVPMIETERLVLRAPEAGDWPVFRAFRMSDRTAFTGGPRTAQQAAEQFAALFGHWVLRGFGRLIAEDRASGRPVGHFGPLQWDEAGEVELTWSLWQAEAEGRGLATEAALAMKDWVFGALGLTTVIAQVHRDNSASHAIARRLGGQVIAGRVPGWTEAGTVYRMTPERAA